MGVILAVALAVIGFFATAVAGYLTGLVGASNNPVSGVTLIVLLGVALLLKLAGVGVQTGPKIAILAGAVVCVAAAMAGDSLHDLATGYHLGATPRALGAGGPGRRVGLGAGRRADSESTDRQLRNCRNAKCACLARSPRRKPS